ncbi:MAG: GGDEF domain-containing protein [Clostridiales bacterium]|nr:GGDEF domain-containing protein [Clostridiales bacterium]
MKLKSEIPVSRLVIFIILCIVAIAIVGFFPFFLTNTIDKETQSYLSEISTKNAALIGHEVSSQQTLIEKMVASADIDTLPDLEATMNSIYHEGTTGMYKRYGIALPDGTAYTSDQGYIKMPSTEYIDKCFETKTYYICKVGGEDSIDGDEMFAIHYPIMEGDKPLAVFFISLRAEDLKAYLSTDSFNGQEFFAVVDKSGEIILNGQNNIFEGENATPTNYIDRITSDLDRDDTTKADIKKDLRSGNDGVLEVNFRYKDYYIYYSPLNFNDWYLFSCVPKDVVTLTRNSIIAYVTIASILIVITFLAFALYVMLAEKDKRRQLNKILHKDSLTGGLSYAKFCVDVKNSLVKKTGHYAFIVMDIDDFKHINNKYGYEFGNKTIRYLHTLWLDMLEDGEAVARNSAEKFCVLLKYEDQDKLLERLNDFAKRCTKFYDNTMADYVLTPSLGVYFIPKGERNIQNMQTRAVMARATIKGNHSVRVAVYNEDIQKEQSEKRSLEDELERALENGRLSIYFQPQFDTMTMELCGAEALLRWIREDGSYASPDDFISLAEERGIIRAIDKYVYTHVCEYQLDWEQSGLKPIDFSVNISQNTLSDVDFARRCSDFAISKNANIDHIQLEITETALFKGRESLVDILTALRGYGFKILMDDFGTGYSSLMSLKDIPIDFLKLDKAFIDEYDNPRGRVIFESVIDIAKKLGITLVAEGVEKNEQLEYLRKFSVDMVQGFLFSKPMTFENLKKYVEKMK